MESVPVFVNHALISSGVNFSWLQDATTTTVHVLFSLELVLNNMIHMIPDHIPQHTLLCSQAHRKFWYLWIESKLLAGHWLLKSVHYKSSSTFQLTNIVFHFLQWTCTIINKSTSPDTYWMLNLLEGHSLIVMMTDHLNQLLNVRLPLLKTKVFASFKQPNLLRAKGRFMR